MQQSSNKHPRTLFNRPTNPRSSNKTSKIETHTIQRTTCPIVIAWLVVANAHQIYGFVAQGEGMQGIVDRGLFEGSLFFGVGVGGQNESENEEVHVWW